MLTMSNVLRIATSASKEWAPASSAATEVASRHFMLHVDVEQDCT
jgi:hypothetical protein